jgi:hypothetical protein
MVLETSVSSTFNHLTRLEARENFINLSRRESLKSYTSFYVQNCLLGYTVDRRFRGAYCLHHQVIPEDNSERHTRRRENFKISHTTFYFLMVKIVKGNTESLRVAKEI